MRERDSARVVLRSVLVVVGVALCLYVIYQLRKPIGWLIIATFIAVAMSGPVNLLGRRMKRGLAIAVAYLGLLLVPLVLLAVLVPPIVDQANELVDKAPQYAQDVTEFVNENERLRDLEEKYDVTSRIEEEAAKLPGEIGSAATVLGDIGLGLVNSIFAAFTILILSMFMVGSGARWREQLVKLQPHGRREPLRRALERMAQAVGNYVAGAAIQATIAGVTSFIVLSILGVPFAAPLALIVAFFDLIPVVGSLIASVLVAVVVLFVNFPIALIVWVVYALLYQQVENYLIQPQIQRRAVAIQPFVVTVAVLFGSTMFGVAGALLAIPTAAAAQIAVTEWLNFRREVRETAAEVVTSTQTPPPQVQPST